MQDLSKQVGGGGGGIKSLPPLASGSSQSAVNSTASATSKSTTTSTLATATANLASASPAVGNMTFFSALNSDDMHPSLLSKKKAKVLFDYEATDPSEISVSANQIITVQIVPNDNDWVLAEDGRDSGKIPKAYIQIVE